MNRVFKSRFAVFAHQLGAPQQAVNLLGVALLNRDCETLELLCSLLLYPAKSRSKTRLATPATWGAAIEVPLIMEEELVPENQAD
jgi:hypothetical protein